VRNANPIENTGIVRNSEGVFLGTAFIFRYPHFLLTAAHVPGTSAPKELYVELPRSRARGVHFPIRAIHRHPMADLAVLEIEPPNERDITWAINDLFDDAGYGVEVTTFGFPQEWSEGTCAPMPRLFKGYVQRFLEHESHLGFRYLAAELSFSCPGGLSGALVINSALHGRLYGLITENRKTTTELDSVLEVDENGNKFKESFHNIINYGVALWLPAHKDWLQTIVPRPTSEEVARRAANQHQWNKEEQVQEA
jgi:hypothetical protein